MANGAIIGAIVVNIFLAVALGVSTNKLWIMIGTLQIIAHFPMLKICFPSNALLCFQSIVDVANMNILPKSFIQKLMGVINLGSSHTSSIASNFKLMDIFSILRCVYR